MFRTLQFPNVSVFESVELLASGRADKTAPSVASCDDGMQLLDAKRKGMATGYRYPGVLSAPRGIWWTSVRFRKLD